MMIRRQRGWMMAVGVGVLIALVGAGALAQLFGGGRFGRGGGRRGPVAPPETAPGSPTGRSTPRFKSDVFTFARVQYDSYGGRGWGRGGSWQTDYPDSDYNFSYRLQQLTALKVNPDPVIVRLTDDKLFDYPFLYMIEPGHGMSLSPEEVVALRRYLLNGGFLMVDDFWGDDEYENFRQAIYPVLNQDPQELPIEHEIFHNVYRLKEKPQVPNVQAALWGRESGVTWEERRGDSGRQVHYKGLTDPEGRLVAIICHNTDLGDGWEREGEDPWYFKEFAEKRAYPMGINIITYAMTH